MGRPCVVPPKAPAISLPQASPKWWVPSNPSRSVREKWRKRRHNLLKKANELSQMCDAQIYIIMFCNSKYYTYKSTNQNWPPPEGEIIYFSSISHGPRWQTSQQRQYPVPEHKEPRDFLPKRLQGLDGKRSNNSRHDQSANSSNGQDNKAAIEEESQPKKTMLIVPRPPVF